LDAGEGLDEEAEQEGQADPGEWIARYNHEWPHGGSCCYGETPTQTLEGPKHIAEEKYSIRRYRQYRKMGNAVRPSSGCYK